MHGAISVVYGSLRMTGNGRGGAGVIATGREIGVGEADHGPDRTVPSRALSITEIERPARDRPVDDGHAQIKVEVLGQGAVERCRDHAGRTGGRDRWRGRDLQIQVEPRGGVRRRWLAHGRARRTRAYHRRGAEVGGRRTGWRVVDLSHGGAIKDIYRPDPRTGRASDRFRHPLGDIRRLVAGSGWRRIGEGRVAYLRIN